MADFELDGEIVIIATKAIKNVENLNLQFEESIDKLNSIDGSLQLLEGAFNNFVRQSSIGTGITNNKLTETNILLTDMVNMMQSMDAYASEFFDNFSQGTKKLEDDEEKATMSLTRFAIGMAAVSAAAKRLFDNILEWSPSLAAAFAVMEVNMGLAAMEIGEALAPVINDVLVPATEKFLEFVQNLSPDMKKFLGVTIALIIPLGLVAAAILAATSPMVLMGLAIGVVIVAVAALVAGIIIFGDKIDQIFEDVADTMRNFFTGTKDKMKEAREGIFDEVGFFGGAIAAFGMGITTFIIGIVETIIDVFATVIEMIGSFVGALKALLSGDLQGFFHGLAQVVIDFLNFFVRAINNLVLDPFNMFFNTDFQLNEIDDIVDLLKTEQGMAQGTVPGTIDYIIEQQKAAAEEYVADTPIMHSGGIFMGDRPGLAMLKPRERVLTETEQRSLGLKGPATQTNDMTSNNITYNITIQGGTYTSPAQRRMEAEGFARQLEKQSNSRGFI